jgi:hypothetical protein
MFIHTYEIDKDVLQCGKGQWYYVAFNHMHGGYKEIATWCYNTFGYPGPQTDTQYPRWKDGIIYGEIAFNNEQDRTLFVLKWAT